MRAAPLAGAAAARRRSGAACTARPCRRACSRPQLGLRAHRRRTRRTGRRPAAPYCAYAAASVRAAAGTPPQAASLLVQLVVCGPRCAAVRRWGEGAGGLRCGRQDGRRRSAARRRGEGVCGARRHAGGVSSHARPPRRPRWLSGGNWCPSTVVRPRPAAAAPPAAAARARGALRSVRAPRAAQARRPARRQRSGVIGGGRRGATRLQIDQVRPGAAAAGSVRWGRRGAGQPWPSARVRRRRRGRRAAAAAAAAAAARRRAWRRAALGVVEVFERCPRAR